MTPIRELTIDLEFLLIAKLRPTFLAISAPEEDNEEIHIVISCMSFTNKTIQERVTVVFSLIQEYLPAIILEERLLVIQTYSNREMESVLDDIFSEEIF